MIAALRFKVNDDYSASIYPAGSFNNVDWENSKLCSLGSDFSTYEYKKPVDGAGKITIAAGPDGTEILRLTETKRYIIKINTVPGVQVKLPFMQNEGNKSLKLDKDENTVTFQFINYLGRSKISFQDRQDKRFLPFEIVPDKMDYEDDYIRLTESLAEKCAELLLDYSGSTSNMFALSEDESKTLMEQFIFLRQFCFSENIQGMFEAIKRNPDRVLVEEDMLHPLGAGIPSKKVYSHPLKYARNWNRYNSSTAGKYYMPSEVIVSKKVNNLDTTANRFLKFALEQFDDICESLIESLNINGAQKQTECRREAKLIHGMISDILRDHFFDEVGPLDIMPQNNQVLQKREGYSQIFAAYAMIDLALQLDWKGEDAVYEGESKNVALLYEYWLYFELCKVVESIDDCFVETAEESPFISSDNGKLIISLQEGKKSCQSFHIPRLKTKINLYYNRTFSPNEFRTTRYEGSYSRPFRPDYTLAIFSDNYSKWGANGENEAIRDGAVSYVHFDAKYRITDLTSFIGKYDKNLIDEKLEIEEEKAEEIVNIYKRGDLLKMHTYNDAIRRTVGSYVLYPGSGSASDYEKNVFSLYDEILPGVGAFAIKPSIGALGEAELTRFIANIVTEKAQKNSRLNRMKYYSEMILREPSSPNTAKKQYLEEEKIIVNLSDKLCVVGYIRADSKEDYYYYLHDSGKLENGSEFYFYYYAIKDGTVYSHHYDIAKAGRFRFFTNNISESNTYKLEPIIGMIETNELISKADLVNRLTTVGYMTNEKKHHADYYYIMKVKVINDSASEVNIKVSELNAINGNDSFSPHSPKVLPYELIGN